LQRLVALGLHDRAAFAVAQLDEDLDRFLAGAHALDRIADHRAGHGAQHADDGMLAMAADRGARDAAGHAAGRSADAALVAFDHHGSDRQDGRILHLRHALRIALLDHVGTGGRAGGQRGQEGHRQGGERFLHGRTPRGMCVSERMSRVAG